ncbi:DUF5677 domain-containing protein [Pseudomonas entomophila]|uniref:DUF5677 domain-containing protein n=1 Tax=Pseudomonas entomophila TaxID=312306 RepID=UPI0023D8BE2C|nr:DUF5677 domain-containing protein [Pseudomonas entomophila]MDF0732308.1 DUF5677 domain-containing protein [Pseudomonas entomophila]
MSYNSCGGWPCGNGELMITAYERNTEIENDFNVLITLMADMITAQALAERGNTQASALSIDLHVLAIKLFKHLCSARTLLEPCGFRTSTLPPHAFIDQASVHALIRSAFENYLVMYWLCAEGCDECRSFRHNIWTYSGLKKLSNFFATIEEAKIGKQKATEEADALWPLIEGAASYKAAHASRQRSIRKGDWQGGLPWKSLATEAGIHETFFTSIYNYLSGQAHSDSISCLQVGQAKDLDTQYYLASSSIRNGVMLMAHFALFYATLFPVTYRVIEQSAAARELISVWSFTAEDMEFLYKQEDSSAAGKA